MPIMSATIPKRATKRQSTCKSRPDNSRKKTSKQSETSEIKDETTLATEFPSLVDAVAAEFENQEGCDVTFVVDNQTIGAHRLILRARKAKCPVLAKMVNDWKKKMPLPLDGVTFDTFKELLRYIYTDEISIPKEGKFAFLEAAAKFEMRHLEELCITRMEEEITWANFGEYMNEAVNYQSAAIIRICKHLFSNYTSKVLAAPSFLELSQPALSALLDVEETDVLEIKIFNRVKDWMVTECTNNNVPVDGANMRDVVGDALYKIRFPTMTVQDFANSVTTIPGLLTDSEKSQIFEKISVFSGNVECCFSDKHRYGGIIDKYNYDVLDVIIKSSSFRPSIELIKRNVTHSYQPTGPLRILAQCFADLSNTPYFRENRMGDRKTLPEDLHVDFEDWIDSLEYYNGDHQQFIEKFREFRRTLDRVSV